ncbi:phage recombination protein Bet [uncultured Parabacteroides sp.]|uniref:phage recombination protein Bet n=1 Tax=uncultured Parabacteroides sp. TaxID=512312 RepID=UPI00261FF1CD|nr:phage recombination protein Bet [uncultured Parabacteroides sp.]
MEEKNQVNQESEALAIFGKGKTIYQVAGNDVALSFDIVRNYLTKGNGQVSDQDIVQFISICKFNQLNPFLNEAYLVKFGQQPAQMIVSKEAFFKRADANEQYEGFKAGIILIRDNQIVEVEGCFFNEKTDTLVGGWCEVYRSDRKFPIIAKVNLSEYDKKQSIWNEKKSTMISKIAKVQALREAFPAQLGAMYTQEESVTVQDAEYEEIKSKDKLAELAEKAAGVKEPKVTAPTEQPQTNTSKQPQQKTLL